MSSGSGSGSGSGSSSRPVWTFQQNKKFESALVSAWGLYESGTDNFWNHIVEQVGAGKSVEDIKEHYEQLVKDVKDIEDGKVPIPDYKPQPTDSGKAKDPPTDSGKGEGEGKGKGKGKGKDLE